MRIRSGRCVTAKASPRLAVRASMTSKSALVSRFRRTCDCLPGPRSPGCAGSWLPHLCFDPHRQREREGRSLALLGFHPDPAAMHLDDALGNRQAETGPALLARDRAVGLLKFLEDLGLIGRGDAGPRIAYRNRERAVGYRCSDCYLALVGELYRVADQVEQDLGEPPFVPAAGREVRRHLGGERQALLSGKRLDRGYDPMHHVTERVVVEG